MCRIPTSCGVSLSVNQQGSFLIFALVSRQPQNWNFVLQKRLKGEEGGKSEWTPERVQSDLSYALLLQPCSEETECGDVKEIRLAGQ